MKQWHRIELFTEEFMTCVPSVENDYRVHVRLAIYDYQSCMGCRKSYGKCSL